MYKELICLTAGVDVLAGTVLIHQRGTYTVKHRAAEAVRLQTCTLDRFHGELTQHTTP